MPVVGFGVFVMMQRQMVGLRDRAETAVEIDRGKTLVIRLQQESNLNGNSALTVTLKAPLTGGLAQGEEFGIGVGERGKRRVVPILGIQQRPQGEAGEGRAHAAPREQDRRTGGARARRRRQEQRPRRRRTQEADFAFEPAKNSKNS